jgi:FecR-like protein
MKPFLTKTFTSRSIALGSIVLFFAAAKSVASAPLLEEARVSQVIQDVRLLEEHAAARRAVVNDKVTAGRAVRTGTESRAELTFTDLTITRLGANTIFSLTEGAREINLKNGSILVQVPRSAAPVTISTAAVTAGISGGTALLSTGPPLKFMVLEGTGKIYPKGHPEKAVTVPAGEMVLMTADGRLSQLMQFDVQLVLATSALIVDFPPLPNLPLILAVVDQQLAAQLLAGALNQPLYKNLFDVIDVTSQSATGNPIVVASVIGTPTPTPTPPITPTPTPPITPTPTPPITPTPTPPITPTPTPPITPTPTPPITPTPTPTITPPPTPTPTPTITPPPTPTPTPSKFGPPSVIASPVPYLITSGTVITTDPSITTSGVTDFGKDYRGPTDDGPFSLWAFGSTSAFDTTVGIDNFFANPANVPIAVFKFQSLSIIGNPTIDLTSGGVTKLGLIGVDGITTGPPGGTLTFTGLDTLLLATVNGPINLTSDVSFDGISLLYIYARGAGSTLTLASPILNSDNVFLASQGSMDLMVGITANDSLTFIAGGDLTVTGSGQFTVGNVGGTINAASIALRVGGSINTVGVPLNTTIDNTGGVMTNGASITISSSGAITVQGDATFQILNSDNGTGGPPGQIGGNATIDVTTGGDFSANSLTAIINDRHAGSIGSSALLAFNVGGAVSTTTDATLGISTRNDGTGGGTIGSDATVSLNAGSISVGGAFTAFVSTNAGGSITGNAIAQVSATGDMVVQGPIDVTIGDTGFNQINPINFIAGGHIGGNATVTLSAQNIITSSTATGIPGTDVMALEASIYTNGQGTLGGNAIVNVIASQDISAPGTVFFTVANGNYQNFGPGIIGGDAQINVTASNLSTGALFDDIYNYGGGSIGRDAIMSLDVANGFTATGNAEFLILNFGGIITRNASVNVSAGSISAPSLTAEINNNNGGFIGGNATINLNIGGLSVGGSGADFTIDNSNGGTIGGNAAINLGVAGTDVTIDNSNGGMIGGNATINVNTTNVSIGGSLSNVIDNSNGGTIGGNASITVNAANVNAGGSFSAGIESDDVTGGHITGSADVNLTVGGNLTAGSGGLELFIDNQPGTIGTDANIVASIGGNVTAGQFADATIFNTGGTISSNADITTNIMGDLTTGSAVFNIYNFGGGTIGSNAGVTTNIGGNLTASDAEFFIWNYGLAQGSGSIGQNAFIDVNLTGDLNVQGTADFEIINSNDGGSATIGGDATINVAAANITANSLVAQIDNTGGSIGATTEGGATINMNVSGTATVTNNATVAIYGSDGATSAAININGGTYNVGLGAGGTFLSYIDGNGTITFNNASAHADVLKAGVFGTNGMLNVSGGMLSANTTLKLYAPGSNGTLNFISSVTLSSGTAIDLAANTITIQPSVLVTIAGAGGAANIYTTNANYSGFGGTNPSNGTFGGNGANAPQPLANAPLFNDPPATPANATGTASMTSTSVKSPTLSTASGTTSIKNGSTTLSSSKTTSPKPASATIDVRNTSELLSLLDGATTDPDGKIRISRSKSTSHSGNSSRINADGVSRADRRATDIRHMRDHSAIDSRVGGGKRIL